MQLPLLIRCSLWLARPLTRGQSHRCLTSATVPAAIWVRHPTWPALSMTTGHSATIACFMTASKCCCHLTSSWTIGRQSPANSRSIATSAVLLKAKKKPLQTAKEAASAPLSSDLVGNQELLHHVEYEKLTTKCQAELTHFQELLFRNLRLQITADVLHDLEVSSGGRRVPLGSLADVYQKSNDTIVIDIGANRAAVPDVRQALSLKGFSGREQADSDCIFVSLPRVTMEHRRRLAGNGREMLHKAHLVTKRLHDSASKRLKDAEKTGQYSKDDLRACQQLLVALIKRANAQLDAAWAAKEKELLAL